MGTSQSVHQSQALGMGRLREDRKIYQIVDMHGEGQIVQYLRYAITSGDTSFLEGYLETKVPEFMYNQGKGKVVTVTELVKIRNKERNERLSAFLRKKGKGKSGPNVLDDFNQEGENVGDLKKALKLLDGGMVLAKKAQTKPKFCALFNLKRKRALIFENIIQNPLESFIRTFILTIGEFTVLYRNLAMCPASTIIWVGKTLFLIFEMGVSILQFNMLIAMLTRTYEAIFRTKKEYKRQWAQVILMLEVSLSPKDRLMNLLKYSRPTGTNKRVRSLVVSTKSTDADKTVEELDRKRKEKAKALIDEKKALYKRRLKDLEQKEGIRPVTSFGTPVTTINK